MDVIHHIENDPTYGTKLTFIHYAVALTIHLKFFEGEHVAPWIMDLTQWFAWVIGSIVGIFTAVSYVKKWFFKK